MSLIDGQTDRRPSYSRPGHQLSVYGNHPFILYSLQIEHSQLFIMWHQCTKPSYQVVQKVSLEFQKKKKTPLFKWRMWYMKHICLSYSVFPFPRNMHLEEMSLFVWSITVMAVYVWESGCLFPPRSLFSAGSRWGNSQLHCAISRISGFVVLSLSWEGEAPFFSFYFDGCCSPPRWTITARWGELSVVM